MIMIILGGTLKNIGKKSSGMEFVSNWLGGQKSIDYNPRELSLTSYRMASPRLSTELDHAAGQAGLQTKEEV